MVWYLFGISEGVPFQLKSLEIPPIEYEEGISEGIVFRIGEAITLEYNMLGIPIQYVHIFALVKRNGKIVHYDTPYKRFETERPIKT